MTNDQDGVGKGENDTATTDIAARLTLKVPPLLLAAGFACLAWLASVATPGLAVSPLAKGTAVGVFALSGLLLVAIAVRFFLRSKTSLNPLSPGSASSLATGSVYRFTRNPMYLGLLFLLIAWAAYLSNLFSLIVVFGFVVWMNRFQIVPEEKALESKFGGDYLEYKRRVRRWL